MTADGHTIPTFVIEEVGTISTRCCSNASRSGGIHRRFEHSGSRRSTTPAACPVAKPYSSALDSENGDGVRRNRH